jgi:arylsulfatase A-like enzyme
MKAMLVLLDTLRTDFLEPYGSTWVHTPNISRLAERSMVCDNHWVGSLPCMPARRELMTGRHSHLERGWGPLEPFDDVLTDLLRQRNARPVFSHLITDHYHYAYLGGEGHFNAFDTWQFERGQESDRWISRVDLPSLPETMWNAPQRAQNQLNRLAQREEHEFSGPRCVQHAVQWLDDNAQSDDWFLQVELFDPHEPFTTVQAYRDLYGDAWDGPLHDWPQAGECSDDPGTIEHIRRCYAALVTMTDHWLGKLWDAMDAHDLWRDTLVILTTDHGSMLGEHDAWLKNAMPVYNEIAHIPCIAHLPGSRNAGSRVTTLTQTTDLMPTFLDWFDAPTPPHVHGRSLRPVLESGDTVHDSVIYGYFGMALNVTDGCHTYFRNPIERNATIHHHTTMPTTFHGFLPRAQLAQADCGRYLRHAYDIPVYRIPATGQVPLGNTSDPYVPRHDLYNIRSDPGQAHPLQDPDLERHFCETLRAHLQRVDAPGEHVARLGL